VLANSTWFSATAVVPALERDWGLTAAGAAWLVVAVQAGFIAGSIAAALLNLPDRIEPRRLIAGSAIAAAAANALLVPAGGLAAAIPLRFLVGVALAGVYAPGVRLVATHYVRGRGVATGVVVGALTLGSATPHLVRGLGDVPWPATILTTSALALLAAAVIRPVTPGLDAPPPPSLNIVAALHALRARPVRLTTFGYLGHMSELYAFWAASGVLRRIPPRGRRGRSGAPADGRDRLPPPWASPVCRAQFSPDASPTGSGARSRPAPRWSSARHAGSRVHGSTSRPQRCWWRCCWCGARRSSPTRRSSPRR
jgi:hypothetical protein